MFLTLVDNVLYHEFAALIFVEVDISERLSNALILNNVSIICGDD